MESNLRVASHNPLLPLPTIHHIVWCLSKSESRNNYGIVTFSVSFHNPMYLCGKSKRAT